jgi:hypothetical protein
MDSRMIFPKGAEQVWKQVSRCTQRERNLPLPAIREIIEFKLVLLKLLKDSLNTLDIRSAKVLQVNVSSYTIE